MINYSLKSLSVALLSQQRYTVISRFDFYVTLQTIFLKFGIDIKNICQPGDVMVCFIGAFPQEIRFKKSKYRRALKYYLGHLYRKKTQWRHRFSLSLRKRYNYIWKNITNQKKLFTITVTQVRQPKFYIWITSVSELYDNKAKQNNNKNKQTDTRALWKILLNGISFSFL